MYAAQQDMVDRYGQQEIVLLTDRADPPAGVIDTDVLDRALTDAAAEIDAHISVRHQLPLDPAPTVLVRVACDIARYRLAEESDTSTDEVRRRYDQSVKFLEGVAAGRINLGAPPADVPASAGAPATTGSPRTFDSVTLEGF